MSKRAWIEAGAAIILSGAGAWFGNKLGDWGRSSDENARREFTQPATQQLTYAKKLNSCNLDTASRREIDSAIHLANLLLEHINGVNAEYDNARVASATMLGKLAGDKALFKVDSSKKADLMRQLRQTNAPNSKLNNKALDKPNTQLVRANRF